MPHFLSLTHSHSHSHKHTHIHTYTHTHTHQHTHTHTPDHNHNLKRLCKRNLRNYARDKVGLRARLGQTLFFGTLLSLIFANLENDVAGVQDRQGVLFFSVISMGLTALLQAVLTFPFEKLLVMRETKDGAYSGASYFLAKSLSEAPFQVRACAPFTSLLCASHAQYPPIQVLFPTLFSVILYFSTDLRAGADHFFVYAGVLVCVAFTAQSLGLMVGALAPSAQIAIALAPVSFVPFMLMGGLFANRDRLDPYWLWLEKISFVAYGYEAIMRNELKNNCYSETGDCTVSGSFTAAQAELLDGDRVIDRLNFDLSIGTCFIALGCLIVLYRSIGFFALLWQLSRHAVKSAVNRSADLDDARSALTKFDLDGANMATSAAHERRRTQVQSTIRKTANAAIELGELRAVREERDAPPSHNIRIEMV
jgi:ABC-type multidrug transport system permease subunit